MALVYVNSNELVLSSFSLVCHLCLVSQQYHLRLRILELQFSLFGQRIHPLWLGVGSNLVSGRKGSLPTNMLVIKPLTKLQMVPEKKAPREQI